MLAKKINIFLLLLIVFSVFAYILIYADSNSNSEVGEVNNVEDEEKDYLSMIELGDSPSLGDEDAPVIMVNYSSYYCPFCSNFKQEIFPSIKEKYIDTGKVRYFYKDAGDPGDRIFLAAHCAGFEDKFWEYQALLVERGIQSEDDLFVYADELVLDTTNFEDCLEDGCCKYIIEQTQKEMEELGIMSIPYFIINGTAISGLDSVDKFFEVIEDELSKKGL